MPFPANYGGVIDVYYKIKALHDAGIRVHLHAFSYKRKSVKELEEICASVHYYQRKMSKRFLFSTLPFIVVTRKSEDLIRNLERDDAPILFEGLHCCGHLDDPRLQHRFKMVRMHNIEHDYYAALAKAEPNFFRRSYFNREARKLKAFETILKSANVILAISPGDTATLASRYAHVKHIMAFHGNTSVVSAEGSGTFSLYHGNLEVGENNQAALFLVREIFAGTTHHLVIAGNNPSADLLEAARRCPNIEIKGNISTAEIDQLIEAAQINILPTFQATGIKLKLLAALFRGRHCLVNHAMVANTGLDELCIVSDTAITMRQAVDHYMQQPFTAENIELRRQRLSKRFSNAENVKLILKEVINC